MIEVGTLVKIKKSFRNEIWYTDEWFKIVRIHRTVGMIDGVTYLLNKPLPNGRKAIWSGDVETINEIRLQKIKEIFND